MKQRVEMLYSIHKMLIIMNFKVMMFLHDQFVY